MASQLTKTEGSIFMNNPIIYTVLPHAEPDSGCAFHRVKLVVTMKMSGGGMPERIKVFDDFSQPVTDASEVVQFDVSSAFISMAEAYVYSPVEHNDGHHATYPYFEATIQAKDVWLKGGVLVDPAPVGEGMTEAQTCDAIMGGYSDYERHLPTQTLTLSRKPSVGEIVFPGDTYVYAAPVPETSRVQPQTRVISDAEVDTLLSIDGRTVYVSAPHRDSHIFQFVNSRGVIESIRLLGKDKETAKGGNEEHVVSRFETFTKFSRILTTKKATRAEFTMSSGPVSYAWARWFAYEFGRSQQYWMLTDDGVWLPCSVTVDDSVTVIDRSKADLCSVDFVVSPNINGPLF